MGKDQTPDRGGDSQLASGHYTATFFSKQEYIGILTSILLFIYAKLGFVNHIKQ